MTLDDLKELITNESIDIEFKSTTGELKQACHTLCAFLNSNGGIVFIGVKNDCRIVGQMVSDNTRLEIANELVKFEPPANIKVEYIPVTKDKEVILLQVAKGPHQPYIYDGKPYEKVESSTRKMTQARYHQLLSQQNQVNHSWEQFYSDNYTLHDLDHEIILRIIRLSIDKKRLDEIAMREDISTVLEKLELIGSGRVKNAAMVLFGKKFLPYYPQCHIQLARFKGLDRHEFLDHDSIYGNIIDLIDKAMLFIVRHLPTAAKIVPGKLQRVETTLIPLDVIREAIINSFCHRDYSVYGGSVKLAIYDDRMEILNNGGLLPGVTIEKIKSGYSQRRNPLIGDILFRAGYIEKWGRGIKEIYGELKKAGDPEPEFQCDEYDFQVKFRFSVSMNPGVVIMTDKLNCLGKLTERQREIFNIIGQLEEARASEVLARLSASIPGRTLRHELGLLKKRGFINSKGSTKNTIWLISY